MFSATLPPELNRLAKEALIEPVRVDLGVPAGKPAAGITQAVYPVPSALKSDLLDEMLSRAEVRSTVVYVRSRSGSERLAKLLQRRGYAVAVLDDHLSQNEREQTLEDLKRGRMQILVASNTSARSLDVAGIAHVVNFDVPQTAEDYVQRLGRTGRGDSVGDAFTLMSPEEQKDVAAVEQLLGRAIPRVLLPDFDYDMRPGEFGRAAALTEEAVPEPDRTRPGKVGLQAAVTRIAAVERTPAVLSNGAKSPPRSAAHAVQSRAVPPKSKAKSKSHGARSGASRGAAARSTRGGARSGGARPRSTPSTTRKSARRK